MLILSTLEKAEEIYLNQKAKWKLIKKQHQRKEDNEV